LQSVMGIEVAVVQNNCEEVYGIVSNFNGWYFLKRTDDDIEKFVMSIDSSEDLPEQLCRCEERRC